MTDNCINLSLNNNAFGNNSTNIYINCQDNKGNNCINDSNKLAITIANKCSTSIFNPTISFTLSNILLLNRDKINIDQSNQYSINVTGANYNPTIKVIPKETINFKTILEFDFNNIDSYSLKPDIGRYLINLNYTINNIQSNTNIGGLINLTFPPNSKKHDLHENVSTFFTSSSNGGRPAGAQVIYNSAINGYNSDIPNNLVFSIQNTNSKKVLQGSEDSKFIVSFVTSEDDYSYGALTHKEILSHINLSHDPKSFGKWNISYNNQLGYWSIQPQNSTIILGTGKDAISTFIVDNIIANYQSGLTLMYINYESIPDYNDSNFALIIQKDPPQPTIASLTSNKKYYNNSPLINPRDTEIIFNYYLYGAKQWKLTLSPLFEGNSKEILIDLCQNTNCNQHGSITLAIKDLDKSIYINSEYTYLLDSITEGYNPTAEKIYKSFYINYHSVINRFLINQPKYFINNAGDVNGDGIIDLIIGNPWYNDDSVSGFGCAFIIYGNVKFPNSFDLIHLNKTNGSSATGGSGVASFAHAIDNSGDINNDNIADIIINNVNDDNGDGTVYVVFGNKNMPSWISLILDGSNGFSIKEYQSMQLGYSISNAGDVNGDGIADLVIGAPHYNAPTYNGAVYVIFGSDNFPASFDITKLDGSNGFSISQSGSTLIGYSVSSSGDVNKDGINDIAIGAPSTYGISYVLFGNKKFPANVDLNELDGINGFYITGNTVSLGSTISNGGDINGDGYDDIVIGAPNDNNEMGITYVIFGNSTLPKYFDISNLNGSNGFYISSISNTKGLATSLSNGGDINGDGFDDIVIGSFSGIVYIIYGNAKFPPSLDVTKLNGSNGFSIQKDSSSITSVSNAGDINGDGIIDIAFAISEMNVTPALYIIPGFQKSESETEMQEQLNNNLSLSLAANNFSSLGDTTHIHDEL